MSAAPDLIQLASDPSSSEGFIRAVNAAGLTGKKTALLDLLNHVSVHGLPSGHANLRARSTVTEIDDSPLGHWGRVRQETCTQADLQVAVARSMAFDRELSDWTIKGTEQHRLHWQAGAAWMFNPSEHSGRTRSSWTDLDEAILQKAIELWRPDGALATKGTEPFTETARLMVSVGRFVHHRESVLAFKRAGIDLDDFAGWTVDEKNPDLIEPNRIWIREMSKKVPLPVAMVKHCNLIGAAELISHWTSPEARNIARQLVEEASSREPVGFGEQLMKVIQDDRQGNLDKTPAHQEALEVLQSLDELHPSPSASAAKLMLLARVITLQNRRGESRDLEFVQIVMDSRSGFENVSLREVLSRYASEPEKIPRALSDSVSQLSLCAIQAHHHELLKSASVLIENLSIASKGGHSLVVRTIGDIVPDVRLQSESFSKTLAVLQDAGLDLWSNVDRPGQMTASGAQKTTSLLHEIASSRTADYASALMVSLDMGANPEIKDHAGRRASSLIDDPAKREHWRSIVRSHVAKSVALGVLDEMNPSGTKP